MLTMLNSALNAHINAIVAITTMVIASVYGLMAIAVNRNTYDRFAHIVDAIGRVVGLGACAVLAAMALTNHQAATIITIAPMVGFITEYTRLGVLERAAHGENNRAAETERDARRIPAIMSGVLALLFAVSATSLWKGADINGDAAERSISATAECNRVANCGAYQFIWTPYELNANGDAYDIPSEKQCRLYVFHGGKLIGTDVIQCDDCPNTTPFTDEVEIVGFNYDDVYFRAGNGMLYKYTPGWSFANNYDHIEAIGENIISCDFFKGAYRYNDYQKRLEHRGWGDSEWTETTDDVPFDGTKFNGFYSCQYM